MAHDCILSRHIAGVVIKEKHNGTSLAHTSSVHVVRRGRSMTMTEVTRSKYTQPDTILNEELRQFDEVLEVAFRFLCAGRWEALAHRVWQKWQLLLPRLTVGYVPDEPEPPPNWDAGQDVENIECLGSLTPLYDWDENQEYQMVGYRREPPPNWIGNGTEWEEEHKLMDGGQG